jgi:oxygenase
MGKEHIMITRTQVIVVGAGPVGLMLAGELRLGGASVVVLEQRHQPAADPRASVLHARTMEIFDCRGLLARLGAPPGDAMGHFGGIPLNLTVPGPYPGRWHVPQSHTEAVLREWAASLGASIRPGHRVNQLIQRDTHVEVEATGPGGTVRLQGLYVVGCDGERSAVRQLAGFELAGEEPRRELLTACVRGIRIRARSFEQLPGGVASACRASDGVTKVLVHACDSAAGPRSSGLRFRDVAAAWKQVTGEDISRGTPLWVSRSGDASRLVTCYRRGRVLLAGDAAHVQMPLGGQALNLGVQDAANLGWKLAAHVVGNSSGGLLDSYHTERHPVAERALASLQAQARLLFGGPEAEPVRAVIARFIELEPVRADLAGAISGLDIRYDVGPGRYPLLGMRVPLASIDATGPVTTTSLLRAARGVLLDLSGNAGHQEQVFRAARRWAGRVDLVPGRLHQGSELAGAGALLLRPDGYIAWAGRGPSGLRDALDRWFGCPAAAPARYAYNRAEA